jgi:hypothetical protein
MKPLLSYLVVRRDLPHSQQVVQSSHAAMAVGFAMSDPAEPVHLAVLAVENQDELMKVVKELEKASWEYELFDEPDHNTGYTALCTYPRTQRCNVLGKLPLL